MCFFIIGQVKELLFVDAAALERDWSLPYQINPSVE